MQKRIEHMTKQSQVLAILWRDEHYVGALRSTQSIQDS